MANTYDKASLVLIPSGTKEGVCFSQKPTNGDGDFTFSRSTAATRVNASGNIEKETQNLTTYSNTFTSSWGAIDCSLTSGQAGYDGSSDAWLLSKSAISARLFNSVSASGVNTFSIYAKAGTLDWVRLMTNGSSTRDMYFDLANGVLGTSTSGGQIDATITSIGGGWYRCTLSVNETITLIRFYPAEGNGNVTGTSGNIYIQDAQLEQGLVARDYIETTTSAVYGGITDNIPRLDYNGSCPSLLLEPQRTNSITQSEYFSDGSWLKYNLGAGSLPVVTDNYADSPEGLQNAARLQLDAVGTGGSDRSRLYTLVSTTSGTDYTFSFYAKSNTGNNEYIKPRAADINYSEITITTEWQRFDVSFTAISTGSLQYGFEVRGNHTENSADILIYGAQLEEGSYATSYIPTYGSAAVTRNSENNIITSATDLIGQTEGTMYYEFNSGKNDGADYVISLSDGSANNRIIIYRSSANQLIAQIRASAVTYAQLNTSVITENIVYKVALGYANNDVVFYVNGVQIGTDTSATIPLTNRIATDNSVGSAIFGRPINQLLLFKTRLTNEELAALTTI